MVFDCKSLQMSSITGLVHLVPFLMWFQLLYPTPQLLENKLCLQFSSVQFSCLCDPMNCSTPAYICLIPCIARSCYLHCSLQSLLEMQNLRPYLELLNQKPYFNKIHR